MKSTRCGPSVPKTGSPYVLIAFLAICVGISAIGSALVSISVTTWYPTLVKPALNPPNWLFAPIWSTLYVLMAVAAWLVWRRAGWNRARVALTLFFIQLACNLAWSALFFGMQRIDLALLNIIALLVLILFTTLAFARVDAWAAALLVPYAVWVAFAVYLNAGIFLLNPT